MLDWTCSVPRIAVDAAQFVGILLQIKQLPIIELLPFQGVEVDQLVLAVGHPVVTRHVVGARDIRSSGSRTSFANPSGSVPSSSGTKTLALHVVGDFDSGDVEEGLGEIEVGNDIVVDRTGLDPARPADQQRRLERFFVHPAFVEPAVFAQIPALVGRVDDDGVVGQAGFVEVVEHATDAVIDALDAAQVVFHVALIFPPDDLLFAHIRLRRQIGFVLRPVGGIPDFDLVGIHRAVTLSLRSLGGEVVADRHRLARGGLRAPR